MTTTKRTTEKEAPVVDLAKKKANLASLMKEINKKMGANTAMIMADTTVCRVSTIPSGSIALNKILSGAYAGGYAKGRIFEIYGPESSGKTTLAVSAAAQAQQEGMTVAYIDAENALDKEYCKALGCDIDTLIFVQPDCGEDAMDVAGMLAQSGEVDLIVVDSVAALVPKAELEGEMGDSQMGLQARLMSKALRRLPQMAKKNDCSIIFINQIREKIGVMFGNPETTTGGRALKFAASGRIEVRRSEVIKEGTEVIGHKLKCKTVKNKIVAPHREAAIELIYGKGFNIFGEMLEIAIEQSIIEKAGSWFSYGNEKIGQGKDSAKAWLKEHKEVQAIIMEKLKALDEEMVANSDINMDDYDDSQDDLD